jgi:hypothetical protein
MELTMLVSGVSYHLPGWLLGLFVLGVLDALAGVLRAVWWLVTNLRVTESR